MRIIVGVVAAIWLLFNVVSAGNTPSAVIQVRPGDTVWKIAAEHSAASQDVRDVVAAIRQINKLDHNGRIYPGQMLKVPVANR